MSALATPVSLLEEARAFFEHRGTPRLRQHPLIDAQPCRLSRR